MSRTTTTQRDVEAQILALVAAQAATRASLSTQAEAMAAASVASFGGWYDTAQITEWAAGMARQAEALQRSVAQTTDAYLARVLSLLAGRRVRPVGRVDVTGLRQGVTHAGAYARAADAYRWQQAEWDRFTREFVADPTPEPPKIVDPIDAAVERVKAVADMDMQLAERAQAHDAYNEAAAKYPITGYRRVIHPEMSKGGSCGLCVAASDRKYRPIELLPIHANCKCTTLPIYGFNAAGDPGSTLNRADLDRLYKEAGSTYGEDLKATRYKVDEHGELGPLLTKDGAMSKTATRVRRGPPKPREPKTPAEVVADIRKVRESLTPGLEKARELAKSDPAKWAAYLKHMEARVASLDQQLAA